MAHAKHALPLTARALAREMLDRVVFKLRTLDDAAANLPELHRLEPRDRAFARLLAASVLRRMGSLDAVLAKCLDRSTPPPPILNILRLGAALCTQDNMPVAERVLEGLWVLNDKCGSGLADPRFVKRLHERGGRVLLDAANKAAAYYSSGGGRIWAQGMLGELNKGLQERRRFTMDGAVEA